MSIKITLNGEDREFPEAMSLPALLEAVGLGEQPVLVELNGEALLKKEIADREIADGDQLEIVRMVAGG